MANLGLLLAMVGHRSVNGNFKILSLYGIGRLVALSLARRWWYSIEGALGRVKGLAGFDSCARPPTCQRAALTFGLAYQAHTSGQVLTSPLSFCQIPGRLIRMSIYCTL